jgi:hypothetical protein
MLFQGISLLVSDVHESWTSHDGVRVKWYTSKQELFWLFSNQSKLNYVTNDWFHFKLNQGRIQVNLGSKFWVTGSKFEIPLCHCYYIFTWREACGRLITEEKIIACPNNCWQWNSHCKAVDTQFISKSRNSWRLLSCPYLLHVDFRALRWFTLLFPNFQCV